MTKTRVLVLISSSIVLVVLAGLLLKPRLTTYLAPEPQDFGGRMIRYMEAGRYDDAVRVGREELKGQPHDSGVYGQIAIVYLVRASKDTQLRERWLTEAVSNIDKALAANPQDPMNVIDSAKGLETAGDLSGSQRCINYQRAAELTRQAAALLEHDRIRLGDRLYSIDPSPKTFTADGHTFQIATLQNHNKDIAQKLRAKLLNNRCE